MKYYDELQYLARCCGVDSTTVQNICDRVENINPYWDDDTKYTEASRIFWALVH